MTDRLPVSVFDLPVHEIRRGYRSAIYFNRAKAILETDPEKTDFLATMQVFQKNNAIACGIDEALAILQVGCGRWSNPQAANEYFDAYMNAKLALRRAHIRDNRVAIYKELVHLEEVLDELWIPEIDELEIVALADGDKLEPWEPVMQITGRLSSFVHLESVYLGVLARRTKVATNTHAVVQAAKGKPVLFFADRFDFYGTQGGDGYAAHVGGATSVASDAMAAWWGDKGMGTMPHALIAAYDGDVAVATQRYHQVFPDTNAIALVDFNNDCVEDALESYNLLGDDLWGVRLDTSENLVDASLDVNSEHYPMGDYKPNGVCEPLVRNVREALDEAGGHKVKIVVSGGFNVDKIKEFERRRVPVDAYAVGSSLLQGSYDYTADVVLPTSKAGRWFRPSTRLKQV